MLSFGIDILGLEIQAKITSEKLQVKRRLTMNKKEEKLIHDLYIFLLRSFKNADLIKKEG